MPQLSDIHEGLPLSEEKGGRVDRGMGRLWVGTRRRGVFMENCDWAGKIELINLKLPYIKFSKILNDEPFNVKINI